MNGYNTERNGSVQSMRFWRPRNERRTVIDMEQDPQDALAPAWGIAISMGLSLLILVAMVWAMGWILFWW